MHMAAIFCTFSLFSVLDSHSLMLSERIFNIITLLIKGVKLVNRFINKMSRNCILINILVHSVIHLIKTVVLKILKANV